MSPPFLLFFVICTLSHHPCHLHHTSYTLFTPFIGSIGPSRPRHPNSKVANIQIVPRLLFSVDFGTRFHLIHVLNTSYLPSMLVFRTPATDQPRKAGVFGYHNFVGIYMDPLPLQTLRPSVSCMEHISSKPNSSVDHPAYHDMGR